MELKSRSLIKTESVEIIYLDNAPDHQLGIKFLGKSNLRNTLFITLSKEDLIKLGVSINENNVI